MLFHNTDARQITPGGIASQSEVAVNDIIVSINGKAAVGMRKSEAMQLLQIMAASGQVRSTFIQPIILRHCYSLQPLEMELAQPPSKGIVRRKSSNKNQPLNSASSSGFYVRTLFAFNGANESDPPAGLVFLRYACLHARDLCLLYEALE